MAPAPLQFFLANTSNLFIQSRLTQVESFNLDLRLNNGGNATIQVDATGAAATYLIHPMTYCLIIYRSGSVVWSGPLWTSTETYSGSSRKILATFVGWFELLNHRVIRSQPGYSLTTSSITFTNSTFESAISGWTTTNATATRDTSAGNFHGGAGSLKFAGNYTGPFGTSIGPSLAQAVANPFSSNPTNGKRYRVNFWAKGQRAPNYMNNNVPYIKIVDTSGNVAIQDLSALYKADTYGNIGKGDPTGSFVSGYIEFIGGGVTTSFGLYADMTPPQISMNPSDWVHDGNTSVTGTSGTIYLSTNNKSDLYAYSSIPDGTRFTSSRSYTAKIYYTASGGTGMGSFTVTMRNSSGSSLGSGSIGYGTGGIATFTFTGDGSTDPCYLEFTIGVGDTQPLPSVALTLSEVDIQETNTNTDALVNIDDITIQEYTGDGIYYNMDAGSIANALLLKANSDSNTRIIPGPVQTTQPRTRTYQRFSNVGKEIKALSDIESGYDFIIDPATRIFYVYNRTNATNFPTVISGQAGVGSWTYSADRTSNLRFDYGTGADNLASFKRTRDASQLMNRINVQGKYALGFAENTTSEAAYGVFEELVSLPDVVDATTTSVLPYYANAEVALRKDPKVIYEIETKTGANTPVLFVDFNIGDRATLRVGSGVPVDSQAVTQTIRIFGVQLTVDAEGNERLSGLQLSDNN